MPEQILDLHIHSKYSRACSKDLVLPTIAKTCETRGIDIVATGDFTHPAWFASMRESLEEAGPGIYWLKDGSSKTKFVIGTEVAVIKKHKDKTRRIHLLLFSPSLETTERFNKTLIARGFNLASDGRPILGLTCKELLTLMHETDPRMVMIPAHAWTPWFGILGSKGGYDALEEAFEELTPHIFSIETGLSSDPSMNWQVSSLDRITLISNSDAHSSAKLGREANVMQFPKEEDVTYDEIFRIIREGDKTQFLKTIEFYPEEGKYHYDGHRDCGVVCHPDETKKYGGLCPKCKRPLVIGVMNRVSALADRTEEEAKKHARIPYVSMVPLPEIIANVLHVGVNTKSVRNEYERLIHALGTEFFILMDAPLAAIGEASSLEMARGIERVRTGQVFIRPGYDGEFGIVKVFEDGEPRGSARQLGFLDI